MIVVRFEPSGLRCHCEGRVSLLEAAQKAGVAISAVCGGAGTCGKCRVQVRGEVTPPTPVERRFLSAAELAKGIRLACQARPLSDVVVTTDTFVAGQILTRGVSRSVEIDPAVRKRWIELNPPSLEDNPFDWEDFRRAVGGELGGGAASLSFLRELPVRLRRQDFRGTCVAVEGVVIDFEKGDTAGEVYGLAIDLGTTTLVVKLLNLASGSVEAVASGVNPQRVYGEDVVSRIQYASASSRNRRELQRAAVGALNELIRSVQREAGVARERLYEAVVVGNTAMLHLLAGVDARYLAQYPYVPAFRGPLRLSAREIGLRIHPRGRVFLLPAIGRFVGGDTVGVLLATDLLQRERLTLAIDIGTNGEIVLGARGEAVACSTAAGPAFEGATIKHGMRAEAGAIDAVWLNNGDLSYHVIGGGEPRGICGSANIDVVAILLSEGIVETSGRMLPPQELPPSWSGDLRRRLRVGPEGVEIVLAEVGGKSITFTQRDVREIQLAKGAIATGIRLLLDEAGVKLQEVDEVLVAGGFGNYIRPENAIRIGLLPAVDPDRIRFVGNAALTGAEMALLSRKARQEAVRIAEKVRYLEIAASPHFQELFAENMLFPAADEVPAMWRPPR